MFTKLQGYVIIWIIKWSNVENLKRFGRQKAIFCVFAMVLVAVSIGAMGFSAVAYGAEVVPTELVITLDYTELYGVDDRYQTITIDTSQCPYLLPEPKLDGYVFVGWLDEYNNLRTHLEGKSSTTDGAVSYTASWVAGDFEYNFDSEEISYDYLIVNDHYVLKTEYCSNCDKQRNTFYFKSEEMWLIVDYVEETCTEAELTEAKNAILKSVSENIVPCTATQEAKVTAQTNTWLDEIQVGGYTEAYMVREDLLDTYYKSVDYSAVVVAIDELKATIDNEYTTLISKDYYTEASLATLQSDYEDLILALNSADSVEVVESIEPQWADIEAKLEYAYVLSDKVAELKTEYQAEYDSIILKDYYTADSMTEFKTSYSELSASLDIVTEYDQIATLKETWVDIKAGLVYAYDLADKVAELKTEYQAEYDSIILKDYYTADSMTEFKTSYSELSASLDIVTEYDQIATLKETWVDIKAGLVYAYDLADKVAELKTEYQTEYDSIMTKDLYTAESKVVFETAFMDLMANINADTTYDDITPITQEWVSIKAKLVYVHKPSGKIEESIDAFLNDPTEDKLQSTKDEIVKEVNTFIRACDGEAVTAVLAIASSRLDEIMLGDGTAESIVDNLHSAYHEALSSVQLEKSRQNLLIEINKEFKDIYYGGAVSKESLTAFAEAYNKIVADIQGASKDSELTAYKEDWAVIVKSLKQLTLTTDSENYAYSNEGFLLNSGLKISEKDVEYVGNLAKLGGYSISIQDENGNAIQPKQPIKVGIKVDKTAFMRSAKVLIRNEQGQEIYVDAVLENGHITFYTDTLGDFVIVYDRTPSIFIYFAIMAVLIGAFVAIKVIKNRNIKKLNNGGDDIGK